MRGLRPTPCFHPLLSSKRGCPRCHTTYAEAIREVLAAVVVPGPIEPKAG